MLATTADEDKNPHVREPHSTASGRRRSNLHSLGLSTKRRASSRVSGGTPPRQGVQVFSARVSVMWLSPIALTNATASRQRSISPNTMSSEPSNVRSWESNGLNADVAFGPFMTRSGPRRPSSIAIAPEALQNFVLIHCNELLSQESHNTFLGRNGDELSNQFRPDTVTDGR
jgi:hypothetical protein